MSVLSVKELRKVFVRGFLRKRTTAVDGISFDVQPGEVFGFLGPNGAGKTTTMKMLMGLIHPTSGEAKVLGAAAGNVAAKRRIGYLPENPYFYDYLSAMEFLHMVGKIYGLDRAQRDRRANELLDRVGLSMAKKRSMRSYSKGMMQRVGLAQALIGDPELVVLDEPMSGLDPLGRKEVSDLIESLRDAGKTVFFCTHILSDASHLCDRVAIIVKGKIVEMGSLGDLLGRQVHAVEVSWEGPEALTASLESLPGEHATTRGGFRTRVTDSASADALVRAIVTGGGRVDELTPYRTTLEEIFVRDSGDRAEGMRS